MWVMYDDLYLLVAAPHLLLLQVPPHHGGHTVHQSRGAHDGSTQYDRHPTLIPPTHQVHGQTRQGSPSESCHSSPCCEQTKCWGETWEWESADDERSLTGNPEPSGQTKPWGQNQEHPVLSTTKEKKSLSTSKYWPLSFILSCCVCLQMSNKISSLKKSWGQQ